MNNDTEERTETHACDCISRQAAITAIQKAYADTEGGTDKCAVWKNVGLTNALHIMQDLPPAQPERCSDCIAHGGDWECDHMHCRKGRLPSAQSENDWIPVTKKAHPDLPIRVQVQMDNGWIITAYYQEGEWLSVPDCDEPLEDEWIEAWRELPEPYKGEQE